MAHVTVIKEEVAAERMRLRPLLPAEPEVAKKGKTETEEAGGDAAKAAKK